MFKFISSGYGSWIDFILELIFIFFTITYRSYWKESQLREDLKDKRIQEASKSYLNDIKRGSTTLTVYKEVIRLLSTPALIYARGSMKKFYEVRPSGKIFTRIRSLKVGDQGKRITVEGQLYYYCGNKRYISREVLLNVIEIFHKDVPNDFISASSLSLEQIKDLNRMVM